jgi:hypothetical protein
MKSYDASDQDKLKTVAMAIAKAMGHEERWHDYLTVARLQIAGLAACQLIDRKRSPDERSLRKRFTGCWDSKAAR